MLEVKHISLEGLEGNCSVISLFLVQNYSFHLINHNSDNQLKFIPPKFVT